MWFRAKMRSHFQLMRFLQIIVLHLISNIFLALTLSRNLKSVTDALHDFSNREFLISAWQFWNTLASVWESKGWGRVDVERVVKKVYERMWGRDCKTARRRGEIEEDRQKTEKKKQQTFFFSTQDYETIRMQHIVEIFPPGKRGTKKKKLEKVTWKHETVFSISWKKEEKRMAKKKKSEKII